MRNFSLVDDGLATGSTMKAAVQAVRLESPRQIVVAVPIAPPDTCAELAAFTRPVVCLHTPEPFGAVGNWYEEFPQIADAEVRALLARYPLHLQRLSEQSKR